MADTEPGRTPQISLGNWVALIATVGIAAFALDIHYGTRSFLPFWAVGVVFAVGIHTVAHDIGRLIIRD